MSRLPTPFRQAMGEGELRRSIAAAKTAKDNRPPGRPPLPPEERLVVRSIRLTTSQWEKLHRLGVDWLRDKIDKAKEPSSRT